MSKDAAATTTKEIIQELESLKKDFLVFFESELAGDAEDLDYNPSALPSDSDVLANRLSSQLSRLRQIKGELKDMRAA